MNDLDPRKEPVNCNDFYFLSDNVADYEELKGISKSIYHARKALFDVTNMLNEAEHKESIAKNTYDKKFRREMIKADGKTANDRKVRAEMACEDEWDEYYYSSMTKKELERVSQMLRAELQTLQVISNNVRQQMRV